MILNNFCLKKIVQLYRFLNQCFNFFDALGANTCNYALTVILSCGAIAACAGEMCIGKYNKKIFFIVPKSQMFCCTCFVLQWPRPCVYLKKDAIAQNLKIDKNITCLSLI